MEPKEPVLRCIDCGYDLAGLALSDACPECGRAIEDSIHGDLLRGADPRYLLKLHRGTTLVLLSLLVAPVVDVAWDDGSRRLGSERADPGWDRFGRVQLQLWRDGTFAVGRHEVGARRPGQLVHLRHCL